MGRNSAGRKSGGQARQTRRVQVELISSERADRPDIIIKADAHLVGINRNALLGVEYAFCIAARERNRVTQGRNRYRLLNRGATGAKNSGIVIEQLLRARDRDKRDGRYRLNVKGAECIFTARKHTLERRQFRAAEAGGIPAKEAERQSISIVESWAVIRPGNSIGD
jgi:hypothetical protein